MNKENTFEIDKITWNDLSLDDIYSRLNCCITSAGEDYLYSRLKNPYIKDCDSFCEQRKLLDEALTYKNYEELNKALNTVSKLKNYSFSEEIEQLKDTKQEKNTIHYVIDFLVIMSFAMIFVVPGPGICAFFAMIAFAVSNYFKTKNIIAGKLTVFNYIIRMLKAFKKISAKEYDQVSVFAKRINRLKEISTIFIPFTRGTFLISEGARTNSNPLSIVFDYIRMIFHVDIIKYNSMISFLIENVEFVEEFYYIVGELDALICVNNIKNNDELYVCELCKPELSASYHSINSDGIYHPLIKDAVKNSIETDKNILITGCNASGKSTFLKTVLLNAIFAQSFGIAFAKYYKAPYFKMFSSMALKDDINAGESYFMSEIKSLKRIVDACDNEINNSNTSILCVIDEVLRGTNTIERIASSAEILKSLCMDNVICIAATHDLELTELLKNYYDNYHFTEEVSESDVIFSYRINKGAASSRNAIRLLSVLGYSEDIVNNATKRANAFVENGIWPPL